MQVVVFEVSAFTYFSFDLDLSAGAPGEAATALFLQGTGSRGDPSYRRAAARAERATGKG